MADNQHFCFKHSSGEDIYLYNLRNSQGTEVLITNYGAIISSFKIGGLNNDIVLGFENIQDYLGKEYLEQYPWFGAAIGRYGNRIKNARMVIMGKTYELTRNNFQENLHGGNIGFDKKVWNLVHLTSRTLKLSMVSREGEEGFPGEVSVSIEFELNDKNELSYEYEATTTAPTALNLTHHSYFNLNNGEGTIFNHELKIPASYYLEQGENSVANGNLLPVKGSPLDFTSMRKIGHNETGYDQSLVLNESGEMKLAAELSSPESALKLEVWTTEPVLHFYSGKFIPAVRGKRGVRYGPGSGLCLETQVHPNAINIPHFPNTVLMPGETYRQKTIYKVASAVLK